MTVVFPVVMIGASTETRPRRLDSCGARAPTTPVGSGSEKLKYGPATGLALPVTGRLVGPAGVPHPVGRWRRPPSRQRPRDCQAFGGPYLRGELLAAPLQHFRDPVEHLAAVVGRRAGPARERPCGPRRLRRGRPCARPARRWQETRRLRTGHRVGPTRLLSAGRPRRCTACTSCAPRLGYKFRTRAASGLPASCHRQGTASSPCRPPSRPKPDSW